MTIPTPAEIAEALDTLRRVPGVTDSHCLEEIVEISSPIVQMTQELIDAFRRHGVPGLGRLASMLEDTAKRHGLRITTDPGDIVGYAEVGPRCNGEPGYSLVDEVGTWQPGDLDMAWADVAATGHLLVALHLVPKGGQS